mmetsp:Transcript_4997/g.9932  ORF Transcript_4997/g.9932 Transcript_4997/m.9932 type:complete len:273 (+) Transcript_4997:116-934(+)
MKLSFLVALFAPLSAAFQLRIGQPAVHPKLKSFAEDSLGKLVQVRLDIGKRASSDRLSLQGPIVKFLDSMAKAIPLPVANGPNPQLSSGNKHLEVVKEGFVIDMNGMKNVPFKEGCWEMTWREGDNAGRIMCGFDLPEPIVRGDVKIPACRVLLTFPVWTKETLALDQASKRQIMKIRQEYMAEKEAALEKMQASSNPIRRAFLYRDAAAAVEKTLMLPAFSHIPGDDDVITLANGLMVSKEGNLYKSIGAFGFGKKLLGTAAISFVNDEDV